MNLTQIRTTVLAATASLPSLARAELIQFTYESAAPGWLGSTFFPSRHFLITAQGDTGDRVTAAHGYFIPHTSAFIAIDGIGSLEFLTHTRTFVNTSNGIAGFSRYELPTGLEDLIWTAPDTRLAAWDMLAGIGPFSGVGWILQWDASHLSVQTSQGILRFVDVNTGVTFGAVVPAPAAAPVLLLGTIWCRPRARYGVVRSRSRAAV